MFEYFSSKFNLPISFEFALVLLCLVFTISLATNSFLLNYIARQHKVHASKVTGYKISLSMIMFFSAVFNLTEDMNNAIGNGFGIFMFLALISFLNWFTFDPRAFCLMNPNERLCFPYKEELDCTHRHPFNIQTGNGHYFDGYAGFFKTNNTGEVLDFFIPYF